MRKDRRSGLWAWAGLGGLGLVLLLASAVISRARPRPIVTQAQIEQRGLRDGQARGIGHVQQVNAISTTLGRMRQHVGCPLPELVFRALLVAARAEAYNRCDPATRLWIVELRGQFPPPFFAQPIRFIYTAAGDYIGSEGGPQ